MRQALFDLLQVTGFAPRAFASAAAFLAHFAANRVDFVITDMRMPSIDGIGLQEQLKALAPDLPVVFVTGSGTPQTKERAMAAGAFAYLTKPVGDEALLETLRAALTGPADASSGEGDERSLWTVRASEQRYRNLIHHLPVALVQVDSQAMIPIFDQLRRDRVTDIAAYLDGHPELTLCSRDIVRVTDANRRAVELLAAESTDELIGAVDFLFAASPGTAARVVAAHFEGRRSYTEIMKLRTFAGDLRDVELSVTYPTPPERLDITLLTLEDVTDRLRTEAQLRQLQADFSRAGRIATLGELATSIAHEVTQPLSAIVTNAETSLRWLAREDTDLAKVEQLTARIAESAHRANDIVQRIRAMAVRHVPERAPIDINCVIEDTLLFVRHDVESRTIKLAASLAPALPPVLGDRVQLQQVIVNLLLNGIQAIGQPTAISGRIELRTSADEKCVRITIRDNGPGVAPENLARVFDGFFTTKEDGIGIGLAICQSIIAGHGGRILVSNHPDGGAEFEIRLPATVPADESREG